MSLREKESTILLLCLTFTAMHIIQEQFSNWMILSQVVIAHASEYYKAISAWPGLNFDL